MHEKQVFLYLCGKFCIKNKMEDYWNVPRELIYRERKSLNDFGVKDCDSLNGKLFQLLSNHFLSANDAKALLLRSFNNAYYLCTIILLEDLPHLKVDKYEGNLLMMDEHWNRDACAASFALAYEMLQVCEPKCQKDSLLLKAICHRFHSGDWNRIVAANNFYALIDNVKKDGVVLSQSEFAPRDIIEVIENSSKSHLWGSTEYICERLTLLKDPSQRVYGTNLAIARIKDYQRELCKDSEYNPQNDSFKYADNVHCERDLDWEESVRGNYQKSKEAIDYYTEHYPTKEENDSTEKATESSQLPETEDFQSTIMELNSNQAKPSNSETVQLQARIKELQEALAQQKEQLSESEKTIKQLQEQIADYAAKYDPKDIKGKKVAVMTGKQHVILYLAILAHHDRIPNARTNLSWELSFISARRESTMHDYLKKRITQEECDALAEYFKETPFIADLIKALPPKLKEDLSEKNRNKALKNNKE